MKLTKATKLELRFLAASWLRVASWFSHSLRTIATMRDAKKVLEQYFLEMRWRCLSLAADLDRIERAEGGRPLIETDPRLMTLRKAIGVLLNSRENRAEQVQMLFSDRSAPPR